MNKTKTKKYSIGYLDGYRGRRRRTIVRLPAGRGFIPKLKHKIGRASRLIYFREIRKKR